VVHLFSRAVLTSGLLGLVLMLGAAPASAAPTAAFDVPSRVVVGEGVTFTSKSTGLLLPFTTTWSFGDGSEDALGEQVTHVFATPGVKIVTLTVADLLGTDSLPQQVTVLAPPVASFIFAPDVPLVGQPVRFASTSGQPIVEWDFNQDGAYDASGAEVQHNFPSSGVHAVRLRVTDSAGLSGEAVRSIRVNAAPEASFTVSPAEPVTGEQATLTSTSKDPEGPLAEAWDLDGDGDFDDASGATVRGSFMSPGRHSIALRVTDGDGANDTRTRAITVGGSEAPRGAGGDGLVPGAAPQAPFLKLMTPFPIVRLAGEVVGQGTRIKRLSVRAQAGAQVVVRCRGGRCPAARLQKLAGRAPLRFRSLERLLPAGSILEVLVRRAGHIGKYTKFRVRRGRVPRRIDACLLPNGVKAMRCPGG
jgi:PKD repeat protein